MLVATSRRELTTSTLVVHGDEVLVVDPAWDPDELAALAVLVQQRGLRVTAGVATHAHHDHLLWHPALGTEPRYASAGTVQTVATHRVELVEALGPSWPADLLTVFADVGEAPGDVVPWCEPVELVVHDGHAPGHAAVWSPERRVLLAGDLLSDVELPLPLWPDDLPAYLAGLDRLAPVVARAEVLVPGHGHRTSEPLTRLDADRRYLDDLLAGRDPADPRRANPGMAAVHDRVAALARELIGR
ncbi:MBL fold metallo-hydrolase [Angustibacter aerolatus]